MAGVVDIMRVKMKAGVAEEEVVRLSSAANARFKRIPGLVRRTLLGPGPDGLWADVVEYDTAANAEQSATLIHQDPGEAQGYFAVIDMPSLSYARLGVRTPWPA